jgi:hypothetical protein
LGSYQLFISFAVKRIKLMTENKLLEDKIHCETR